MARINFFIPEGYEEIDAAFDAAHLELDAVEQQLEQARAGLKTAVRNCHQAYTKLLAKLDPLPKPEPSPPAR